ncbi:MAG: N-acetylneuraminate synthase family protein [Acidobacteria bacterium]|nr:N-acetylneuraminate synthase family protein [Acidobacteriota bacterium]
MPHNSPAIAIAGRRVASDMPPFVIAEIGINHGGSLERALALVDAAAAAGAHAVKLQTIVARDLVGPACPAPAHVGAASMVAFFERYELDEAAHRSVAARARAHGLAVMSSPFSERAVDLLERVGVDAYKIASGDLTWDQLIARCAATGKPLVMSTGMASLGEVQRALDVAHLAGARDVALLHCVSAYPVPAGSENLRAIETLADACAVPVGLSDHGRDAFSYPLAVALGASLYERHLVLEGDDEAADAAVSSTPAALERAIADGRRAWAARGDGRKTCLPAEAPNLVASRRSLCAARDLPAGTVLTPDDLVALRPATGYAPALLLALCGLSLARPVPRGTPIVAAHFERHALMENSRVA